MTVGGVRTSDISDLDRICPMGISNQLNFGWVRYIRSMVGDMLLEPDEARINLARQIYPTWAAATALEPDGGRINSAGRIYLTWGRICVT
jgi:hypothetical protein